MEFLKNIDKLITLKQKMTVAAKTGDKKIEPSKDYKTNGFVKINLERYPEVMTASYYNTEAVFLDAKHVLVPEHIVLNNHLLFVRIKEILGLITIDDKNRDNHLEKSLIKIGEQIKSIENNIKKEKELADKQIESEKLTD